MILSKAQSVQSVLCVPGFFSGNDQLEFAEFLKASSALRDSYRFAHSTDLGIGIKHGVNSKYAEYCFKREYKHKLKECQLIFMVTLMFFGMFL